MVRMRCESTGEDKAVVAKWKVPVGFTSLRVLARCKRAARPHFPHLEGTSEFHATGEAFSTTKSRWRRETLSSHQ